MKNWTKWKGRSRCLAAVRAVSWQSLIADAFAATKAESDGVVMAPYVGESNVDQKMRYATVGIVNGVYREQFRIVIERIECRR